MFYRKRRPQYLCWKPLSFQRNCPLLVHLQKKQPLALLPVGSIRKGNTQLDSFRDVPRHKKLIASTYNGLGTNQTTACIRVQAGNAKLIYDIAKTNRYSIPIRIYRSSNKGPFGKITLKDTTGKIPGNQNYDPTDPAFKNKR